MLVLKCKKNDSIVIGGNIIVTVVSDGKGGLALGITAPKHVDVIRQKLIGGTRRSPDPHQTSEELCLSFPDRKDNNGCPNPTTKTA